MTLVPGGSARARWGAAARDGYPAELIAGLAARDVDEAWLALAHEIAALAEDLDPPQRRALTLWVLAVYGALEAGSTLLPTEEVEATLLAMGVPAADARAAGALAARVDPPPGLARVIGPPSATTPLVRDARGLFPRAAFTRESRVSAWLADDDAARTGPPRVQLDRAAVEVALSDVLARPPTSRGHTMELNIDQIAAVRAATRGRLAVISGGPGTGKTSIVVAILRVLARLGVATHEIALAAPTGKAMHRLQASIVGALGEVALPTAVDEELRDAPPVAQTLHRLLGWSPPLRDYAWGKRHRLPHRVVIVDEGSMIDLALVDRLLESLRDDARLVLLGDADQLPSVEVGAVFRDFVAAGGARAVRLTESYRMRTDDPAGRRVYQVAQAINAGDLVALEAGIEVRSSVAALSGEGVEQVEVTRPTELLRALSEWTARRIDPLEGRTVAWHARTSLMLRHGVPEPHEAQRLGKLLRHAEASRILCVTRTAARPTGVDAVNTFIRGELRKTHEGGYWAPGDPVLVERNDYGRELWNGDFGIVVRAAERGYDPQLMVAFEPERGHFVFHPVAALRGDITHAWAMTVHKAQGSELDRALFVLPWDPIPLMTREIVYTAVSRARKAVAILGPRAVLRLGVERRLVRRSGLADL